MEYPKHIIHGTVWSGYGSYFPALPNEFDKLGYTKGDLKHLCQPKIPHGIDVPLTHLGSDPELPVQGHMWHCAKDRRTT